MNFDSVKVTTKKQNEVILRMINSSEAQSLLNSMVEIAETSPYILTDANFFRNTTIEFETKWIEGYNNDPRSILIVAELNNKIVGLLDFKSYKNIKMSHRGLLGISLHHSVRGEGLGEKLFEKLISEIKRIKDLTIVELAVMGDNHQAYHLYKKMGFIEVGRIPKAFKLTEGNFCDDVQMALRLS
jgi:RimJ/RimL family protein N-acetyltransferase